MRSFARMMLVVVAGVLIGTGHAAAAPVQLPAWLAPEPPDVQAPAAALADGNTGAIRWSRE
ncbi:D-alanyl-D-alanine carboxypeptidase family protein, partial [Nocardia gipuzkoensis]